MKAVPNLLYRDLLKYENYNYVKIQNINMNNEYSDIKFENIVIYIYFKDNMRKMILTINILTQKYSNNYKYPIQKIDKDLLRQLLKAKCLKRKHIKGVVNEINSKIVL